MKNVIVNNSSFNFEEFKIQFKNNSLIINAFNSLQEHEDIVSFMIYFFIDHVKRIDNLETFGFKKALDEVNKQLMQPVNDLTIARREVKENERKRIKVWNNAFVEYEKKILVHLIKVGNKL